MIEALAEQGRDCVVSGLPEWSVKALCGPRGDHVLAVTRSRGLRVVVTTTAEPDPAWRRRFTVAELDYPEARAVSAAYLRTTGASPTAHTLTADVLNELELPVRPAVVAAVVTEAIKGSRDTQAIVREYSTTSYVDALTAWLGEGRSPREIALLAAGTTLSGADCVAVNEQAEVLARMLRGPSTVVREKRFVAGTSWPETFLRPATGRVGTHFGVLTTDLVEVCPPYRPNELLQSLWLTLGPDFRQSYVRWLRTLAGRRKLRWHAAYSAGGLFSLDPVVAEEEILRPWANSRQAWDRRCAGMALGTPVAMGADATASRRLANAWATGPSPHLNHAAVAAYGGVLGAWDDSTIAPMQLYRIARRVPPLATEVHWTMANLVVSGADAIHARTCTLAYLETTSRGQREARTVYAMLPALFDSLLSPATVCVESLQALRSEPSNWHRLCTLVGTALTTPPGAKSGRACLTAVTEAIALGHVDHSFASELIRGTKEACRPLGSVSRLGDALRRTLTPLTRSPSGDTRSVATALMTQFFAGS
ncbi:MAG: hypothetical protein GXX79_07580 [Actinomycetales bacterium]|nr:hypothetical protein [Actinomycetales bacterium]